MFQNLFLASHARVLGVTGESPTANAMINADRNEMSQTFNGFSHIPPKMGENGEKMAKDHRLDTDR